MSGGSAQFATGHWQFDGLPWHTPGHVRTLQ